MTNRISFVSTWLAASMFAGAEAQTLQPTTTVDSSATPRVEVFLGGNVKDVLGQKEQAGNVAGSIGLRYRGHQYVVTSVINITGSSDTLKTGLGPSLLQPAGSGLNAGLLDVRKPQIFHSERCIDNPNAIPCHIGFHAYLSASSARWATSDGSKSFTVPSWGSGIAVSYSFVNGTITSDGTEKKVGMLLDVGWATRQLGGDLVRQDSARNDLLKSEKTNFNGLEVGLTLQFDLLTAGMTYYHFKGGIDGFSNGQIVAGVSLQTNLTGAPYNVR